jgi:hypothetical protein
MTNIRLHSLVLATLAACTMHSEDLTKRDGISHYVSPAICQRTSECDPLFAIAFPGGVPDCAAKLSAEVLKGSDADSLSNCTNAQFQACAADTRAASCPTDPASNGVPAQPKSCDACL